MGKLIVIDGLDGSGKQTQSILLEKRLIDDGKNVKRISFPVYDSWSSSLVQGYLSGKLGTDITKLSPYAITSFYAADRYINYINEWKEFYEQDNSIIISDRYTQSSMLYQSLVFQNTNDILAFCDWVKHYERDLLELPKSDITFFLSVKPSLSKKLMKKRNDNKHNGSDIHEDQTDILEKIYKRFHLIGDYCNCNMIECDNLINKFGENSISMINDIIYKIICEKI